MNAENLVLDTTVLEDYFSLKQANVKKWFDGILTEDQDNIIILHSIFLEFIRRSHYHKNDKNNLQSTYRLFKSNKKFSFVSLDDLFMKNIIRNKVIIPISPQIQFGEFSMINNSLLPNTVIVTSDEQALSMYKNNIRINPRNDPANVYPAGTST